MTTDLTSRTRCLRRFNYSAGIPVVEQLSPVLTQDARQRIRSLATSLIAATPALRSTAAFGERVAAGGGPGVTVVIEDHSAIALIGEATDRLYHYRSLALAGDGDLLLIGGAHDAAFETYCREKLCLGQVEVRRPRPATGRSLTERCAEDPDLVSHLADRARQAGGMNLVPYMGFGHIWRLAGRIAAASARAVHVAAPPPRLTRCVNDKTWFCERVIELLGRKAAPAGRGVYSLSGLVAQTMLLARNHASVAVKLSDAASSMGNLVFEAESLCGRSARRVRDDILLRLGGIGWRGGFPLQVTAWERPVLASPSVQLWIPHEADGPPVLEGLFDQKVTGAGGAFVGATPSHLPRSLRDRLAEEALQLGSLFQALGYFGRCSYDSILVGEDLQRAALHWVECNGRWGGVSIPMTLANRLLGDWRRLEPAILEQRGLDGHRQTTASILDQLGGELFEAGARPHGLVILAPGRLSEGSGFDAMLLEPRDRCAALAPAASARLHHVLGASPPAP